MIAAAPLNSAENPSLQTICCKAWNALPYLEVCLKVGIILLCSVSNGYAQTPENFITVDPDTKLAKKFPRNNKKPQMLKQNRSLIRKKSFVDHFWQSKYGLQLQLQTSKQLSERPAIQLQHLRLQATQL